MIHTLAVIVERANSNSNKALDWFEKSLVVAGWECVLTKQLQTSNLDLVDDVQIGHPKVVVTLSPDAQVDIVTVSHQQQ